MTHQCPALTLNNGVTMPQVGMGTFNAKAGTEVIQNVKMATAIGYRLLDTAHHYQNEQSIGVGIRGCGVPRSELFVTTKLWNYDHGYDKTLAAFERSRKALGVDYIDLYLIHWPGQTRSYIETWRAFEKLYAEKKVRAIGVSNFEPHHIEDLLANCTVPPMVNQVEMHPWLQQKAVRQCCAEKNIVVTAWSPLCVGEVLSDPQLAEVGKKYNKSAAQVIGRWFLQLGVITIPKSSKEEHLKDNFNIFDFELTPEDMKTIEAMDKNKRIGGHPDSFFPTDYT